MLVAALQLKPGMGAEDIGAGTGYLARRIAPAVKPGGKVFAVDVQPELVALLQTAARQSAPTQIQPLLGAVDDAAPWTNNREVVSPAAVPLPRSAQSQEAQPAGASYRLGALDLENYSHSIVAGGFPEMS